MAQIYTADEIMPTLEDVEKLLTAKISYENAQQKSVADRDAWNKANFTMTPWGISYMLSKNKHEKTIANAKNKGWDKQPSYKPPVPKTNIALKYFIVAVAIDWQELITQLKRTLKLWGCTSADLKQYATQVWQDSANANAIAQHIVKAQAGTNIKLVEAVEKHDTLNTKLFNKDETLKEKVRNKMLEIVDEFLADLKEQDIKIKIDDILLIGSNASYNYTKDSDIDLHILANTKAVKYEPEVCQALYSAYRSLFNKQLEIKIFDIPLEIFVETEDSPRVSNGVYSVKKDKWVKKPIHEDIPDYDKEALKVLVDKWSAKCDKLITEIKADKLKDEKKVTKLIAELYDKLRKKGVAKGEYALENLAFKELRNEGYLDQLKNYRNELVSKRLSLEERLDRQAYRDIQNQITQVAGTQPIIQDNGMFFIYNVKASEIESKVRALRKLPFVDDVFAHENGKYDFSQMMSTQLPTKYYDIRGNLKS